MRRPMLSDQVLQLLTAFVDGELSQRQRKAVVRLLQKSSKARAIVKELQENAHKVKKLPRRKVEPSLAEPVLQAIAAQQTQPKPAAPKPRRRRSWVPYLAATMAASVLIAVIGLIVWQSISDPDKDNGGLAKTDEKQQEKKVDVQPSPSPTPTPQPVPPQPTPQPPRKANPLIAQITEGTIRGGGAPIVPFSASFADLKKDGKATNQFVSELKTEKAVQLDVTVKKNSEALARMENVLKNQGIKLVTDPAAKKTVDNKKTEYLVYAENLTVDDVTKLMNELGDNYIVGLNNKQMTKPTPFSRATLNPLEQDAKQNVAKLLGEPALPKTATKAERMVIVLPSVNSTPQSAEVKQFVNQRRAPEPGAIQILIRIRQE